MRYLENRSLIRKRAQDLGICRRWRDRRGRYPGRLSVGSREKLDNLIFVVNCNLQRAGRSGAVETSASSMSSKASSAEQAGHVIKVSGVGDWDELFERDSSGLLLKRMEECVDGDYQAFKARGGIPAPEFLRASIPSCCNWCATRPMNSWRIAPRRPRSFEDLHAYRRAINHHGSPRSSWPRPSRVTAWARTKRAIGLAPEKKLTTAAWRSS